MVKAISELKVEFDQANEAEEAAWEAYKAARLDYEKKLRLTTVAHNSLLEALKGESLQRRRAA